MAAKKKGKLLGKKSMKKTKGGAVDAFMKENPITLRGGVNVAVGDVNGDGVMIDPTNPNINFKKL